MKILILSYYYFPDLSAGSFRIKSIVDSLSKSNLKKLEIDIVTTEPNRYRDFRPPINEKNLDLVNISRVKVSNHKSGLISQSIAFIIYSINTLRFVKNKKYDLVFATSSRLMTGALGAVIASRKKTKLYLDIRDIFYDTINDVYKSKIFIFIKLIVRFIESYTFKKANHINLVSEGFESYFKKNYPFKNYSYFTNGIDSVFDNFPITQTSNEKIRILYAGNIGDGQGLEKIVPQLLRELPNNYYFTIIGNGGKKHKLMSKLLSTNKKNYELLPPISQKDLISKYLEADILFLHLNSYEAFLKVLPSKIFEYAATHKPICAGVSGYSKDFLLNNVSNCSVFEPCNVKEAKNSILNINLVSLKRSEFISKFSRKNISDQIAMSILKYKDEE